MELAQATSPLPGVSHAANFLEASSIEIPGLMPLAEGFASKFAVRWAEPPFGRPAQSKDFRDYAFSLFPHWKLLSSFHAVTFEEDPDGVFRRAPLLFRYGNDWFPSLTLAGVMATVSGPTLKFSDGTLRVLGKGGEDIPGVYFAGSYQL